jgi:uroporphyrinogen decarboxylase
MPRETMTPRERWLAVLRHELPDRVPLDFRATPEATRKLLDYLRLPTLGEALIRLHVDRPLHVGPRYAGPPLTPGTDVFGCRFEEVDYGGGSYPECVYHPLAGYGSVEEIEDSYTWPSPDWWDFSVVRDQVVGCEDRLISGGGSEPFLTYKDLRGQEQAFLDLVLNPELVKYVLGKLYDLAYEQTLRVYEQIPGQVMLTDVAEDMGSQTTLMYSPAQIEEFFAPHFRRMIDLAHEAGAYVSHHSDGAVRPIIPRMVQLGIDVLDPVQWRCDGMEREGLKRDFGDRLVFHGAMDNQYTLAFGSVEEVQQEVRDNIRILGDNGGLILGPCHNVQAVSPPENVVAMYDTAFAEGWY